MKKRIRQTVHRFRRYRKGVAMFVVLAIGIIVLLQGIAMLTSSGQLMRAASDSKQMIRARYAAESVVSIAIVDAMTQSSKLYGDLQLKDRSIQLGEDRATAEITTEGEPSQEMINWGSATRGMRGYKIPLQIDAEGHSAGGAKAKLQANLYVYQVPIFQFGVFYDGPLEISPGPTMFVTGRVHTNSDLYVRGYTDLTFQGPLTVSGKIWQWYHTSRGTVRYFTKPDALSESEIFTTRLSSRMTQMDGSTQPPAVDGIRNVQFGLPQLVLPLGGGNPHGLIELRKESDNEQMREQKYDWKVKNYSSAQARFVAGVTPRPAWISEAKVFFDRREDVWVKFWDFDVSKLIASGNRDSIFYLADTTTRMDMGSSHRKMLNAFRIVNASRLPRNMSIATLNSLYLLGDFNKPINELDSNSYFNAQLASDAFTLLSPQWPTYDYASKGMNGSLEQRYDSLKRWIELGAGEKKSGRMGAYTGDIRVHAAIVTGNKASHPSAYPPQNYDDRTFELRSEGGWHNSIRFREDLGRTRTIFKGSFICLWEAKDPSLNKSIGVYISGFYDPPVRLWGFDPRFKNLANMPPATPYLSSASMANWLERM